MGIFKKDITEDPTKPLESTVPQGESVPVTPDETVTPEIEEPVEQSEEDRSAFNCGNCEGSGLVWHAGAKRDEKCPSCGGTGKVI
jgi:DnaJ-class molecular chaperone